MIRTLWVALNALVATTSIASLVIVASLLGVRGRLYPWAARTWSRWILRASGTPVRVEGIERLAPDRAQIVVGNHESWYDVFAIAASLPKTFHFVAKKELERVPLFGRAWKAAGHISIDRRDRQSAIRSLDDAAARMATEDAAVVIFPEGTRSPDGRLLPFKKGAFMLARKSGVELLPAAVSGSRAVMPKGAWRIRPGPITVRYGAPIPAPAGASVEGTIQAARAAIESLREPGDASRPPSLDAGPPARPSAGAARPRSPARGVR